MSYKTVIAGVLVCAVIGLGSGYYILSSQETHLQLEKETVQVELGVEDYLKVSDFIGDKMTAEELQKVKAKVDIFEDETGKPIVGTYEVIFTYKPLVSQQETERGYLVIKDTTAPKIEIKDTTINIEANAQDLDITKYLTVTDHSKVSVAIVMKAIKLNQAGTYIVPVIATDASNNQTQTVLTVKVIESDKIWQGFEELTPYVDGSTPVSKETENKLKSGEIKDVNKKHTTNSVAEVLDKDNKETLDQKQEKAPVSNKTVCDNDIPADGILNESEAIKSAEQNLEMAKLSETHTYQIHKNKTECGQEYFTYDFVLK